MTDPLSHAPEVTALGSDVYRLICEHAGLALVVTDLQLRIRLWNRSAGRVFGAAANQMIGTPVLSILPANKRAEVERSLLRAIEGHEVAEIEFDQRDPEGKPRHFAASIAPVVDQRNTTLGASVWVRDITKRTELFQEVAQGRKMVALGQMAGAVAHHFNNILGGMVTSVDFAVASNDPALHQRVLAQTGRSLARATHLVENLLAFAEGDRRSGDLADLTEVLLSALDAIEPELANARIRLEVRRRPVEVVEVPRKQMTTVILNLVRNAIDAMPDGGDLCVELGEAGGGCTLRFTDTGRGVAEENLDRIFEPFYSTKSCPDDAADRAPGLGLAVAHGVIHEIGGRITVRSEVGKGTCFEIWLPRKRAALQTTT